MHRSPSKTIFCKSTGAALHKAAEVTHGKFGALNLSLGWNRELGLGFFAGDALLVKARNQDGSWTALDSRPSCSSWSLWTAPCHTRKRNTPVGHVCRRGRAFPRSSESGSASENTLVTQKSVFLKVDTSRKELGSNFETKMMMVTQCHGLEARHQALSTGTKDTSVASRLISQSLAGQ